MASRAEHTFAVAMAKQDATPRRNGHEPKFLRVTRALGSIDITANMRSVLVLGADPENDQRRILAHSKSNNAALGESLAYRIQDVELDLLPPEGAMVTVNAPRLEWDGLSPLRADDLSIPPEPETERPAIDEAQDFLRATLEDGPALVSALRKAAKEAGITWITLRRAKDAL